jgi:hypothetical protein
MKRLIYPFFSIVIFSSCASQQNEQILPQNKKAIWISKALTAIQNNQYPNIKGIAWWHENFDDAKLRLDSSPESIEAYKNNIFPSYFISELTFTNSKLDVPANGIYHGAFPDFGGEESNVTEKRITDFEALTGKAIAWAYFSDNWLDNLSFPYDEVTTIHNTGTVPFIRMMARSDFEEFGADPVYTMQHIIDGDFDSELIAWANEAKNIGYPLLVEFGTEVNGNWFPWNGEHNGGGTTTNYGDISLPDGPERFRDAYRHIIDIFNAQNVSNITWFFHVDAFSLPETDWNRIENYYPGDAYIDWIGLSAYGPQHPDEEYIEFTEILDEIYPKLINLSNKPIAVLEFAITEIE